MSVAPLPSPPSGARWVPVGCLGPGAEVIGSDGRTCVVVRCTTCREINEGPTDDAALILRTPDDDEVAFIPDRYMVDRGILSQGWAQEFGVQEAMCFGVVYVAAVPA